MTLVYSNLIELSIAWKQEQKYLFSVYIPVEKSNTGVRFW